MQISLPCSLGRTPKVAKMLDYGLLCLERLIVLPSSRSASKKPDAMDLFRKFSLKVSLAQKMAELDYTTQHNLLG